MAAVKDEENDIQRLILSGYGGLPYGYFVLLNIRSASRTRAWLRELYEDVSFGDPPGGPPLESGVRLNVAFTYKGFEKLNLAEETLAGFSKEFREGPLDERRLRFMGDVDTSGPEKWNWGKEKEEIDVLLLLYGESKSALDSLYRRCKTKSPGAISSQVGARSFWKEKLQGVELIRKLDANLPLGRKTREHFGFQDGIVQPVIRGRDPRGREKLGHPDNTVAAGEFLLGYLNGRNNFPPSPSVTPELDSEGKLLESVSEAGMSDFGRNGSYLVFRQLEQHVDEFWKWVEEAVENSESETPQWLAAKMMGRWPSGAPLVHAPEADTTRIEDQTEAYFQYAASDPDGHRCPIGSHIRRSNPRDSLQPGPASSLAFANLHRIIRRGRLYGPYKEGLFDRLARDLKAGGAKDSLALRRDKKEVERGLHFLCFNADIASQFEFIQHDWINNPKLAERLYADADPIVGAQNPDGPSLTDTFTVQKDPIRREFPNLRRFVDVRGAGYFFMPGGRALQYLLSLPAD